MADICPVCERVVHPSYRDEVEGIPVHALCFQKFMENKDIFKKKYIEMNKEEKNQNKSDEKAPEIKPQEIKEHQKQQHKIEDKSVYVKGFSMPFGEMVEFMVKWAIASIPAFIILFIIGAILVAIFGALFF